MSFESAFGSIAIVDVLLLGIAWAYCVGWKDGQKSERDRIKKEIKGT